MEEIWKPCYRYEGIYVVSNHGRVARILNEDTMSETRSPYRNCYGHWMISLRYGGISHECTICVLVAHAHLNVVWEDAFYVQHIDENKDNNSVDNLEPSESRVNHPGENRLLSPRQWRTRWTKNAEVAR